MNWREQARHFVTQMTLEEKAHLCVGADFWHVGGVPRLQLEGILVADGPHGLRKQVANYDNARYSDSVPAVCFPTASAVACTFDPDLAFAMGRAMGEECRKEGVSVLLGPGVNMKRSPLGGRNFEYFSEDPLLAGKLAAAMIRGVQSMGVGASLKHFAANSQEASRFVVDSVLDERALRELYLRAFEIAVREGKPWTVMAAYNRLNGTYCCEHRPLLELLRGEWAFDGLVVSDWGAVHCPERCIEAGMDLEMPGVRNGHWEALCQAVQEGTLPQKALDRAAENVTALLLRAKEGRQIQVDCDLEAHHALALKIACSAAVLLKNDGLLPGSCSQSAAVIGALAKEGRYQGSGSSRIHPYRLTCAWDALHSAVPQAVYAPGYDLKDALPRQDLIDAAVEAARGKEMVYLFAGLPDAWESEGFDRKELALPPGQTALIEAVCRANPNTAVLLQAGGAVELPWADLPRAILMLYLGGEAGGEAAAKLLLGEVSPSGKLAETFPLTLEDTPTAGHYPAGRVAQHREGIYIGYRFYDAARRDVRFPFGHGLSYTTFHYDGLQIEAKDEDCWLVRCRIQNSGAAAGAEAVQLYAAALHPVMFRPPQELIAFEKVYLEPGETKEVCFAVHKRDFDYYSPGRHRFVVEEGNYELRVAASSRDIRLRGTLFVPGESPEEDLRAAVPHYYRVDGTFSKEEFEVLLGRRVPRYTPPKRGAYTLNTTLSELQGCRWGRAVFWVMRHYLHWRCRADVRAEETNLAIAAESPLRQAVVGGAPVRAVRAFVALCNGAYRRALAELLGGKR